MKEALVAWLRAHHLLGFAPVPPRLPTRLHQRQLDALAEATAAMDRLEADVAALRGEHGPDERSARVAAIIASQARVLDALANGEGGAPSER